MNRLEEARLVAREAADEDRRGAFAVLTPAGRVALRRAWPVYARGINELFLSLLSEGEVETIGAALAGVRDAGRVCSGSTPSL